LLTPIDFILLPLLAFPVGVLAAMVGVGGGIFIVPLLTLIYDFNTPEAIGTSLAMIIFTSIFSTVSYSRQKRIDYKVGLMLSLITIPGAIVGALVANMINPAQLGLIFGIFLIFVALRMLITYNFGKPKPRKTDRLWYRKIVDSSGTVFEYNSDLKKGSPLSFFGGFFSGLLGIGGGVVMVPIMHFLMDFPIHLAVATSMFIMIFTSLAGAATHFTLGNVHLEYMALLCVGIIFGTQLGAYASKRISGKNLRRIFSIIVILVSILMIQKYLLQLGLI
jgi:uncharacterized membrane protein YfcA